MSSILYGKIIQRIKPKVKPTNRAFDFQKEKPITPYNFPLSRTTTWKAFGYKKDSAGIKRPHWIEKTLPTGHAFVPDLDEVISVYPTQGGGIVSPQKEKKKEFSIIPEDIDNNDIFKYKNNLINDRGTLHKNE